MKKLITILSIILILILVVGSAYLVDMNAMNNNKPVIFSTWGYDYAPPENNKDINTNTELEFDIQEYVKNIEENILKSKESKTFDITLTEELYGKELTEFMEAIEVDEVLGTIVTDEESFVTIIPMTDFLDNQNYYFEEGKLVAYKEDFMGIGGSVTYYFKDNELIYIDETKIEEEMNFVNEDEENILKRASTVYEQIVLRKRIN